MSGDAPSVVTAAGVVCWRIEHGKLRVLLVRPSGRQDVSFPKGKVEPGESLPEAAVRETREETGLEIVLGAPLGTSEYVLPGGRDKVVHYWTAEAPGRAGGHDTFVATDEISAIEWMSVKAARAALLYDEDRAVLDRFAARADRHELRTFAVIALRHGKAVPAASWTGADSTRPLEPLGLEQARASARAIAAFAPVKLISSTAARCMSTIEPVATRAGLDVTATAAISQDAHDDGEADVAGVVAKRIAKRVSAVLCSHGPVLPDILEELATQAGAPRSRVRRASTLDVGAFAVVHLPVGGGARGVVAVETHDPAVSARDHARN